MTAIAQNMSRLSSSATHLARHYRGHAADPGRHAIVGDPFAPTNTPAHNADYASFADRHRETVAAIASDGSTLVGRTTATFQRPI
jgi:hypothetical protein